MDGAVRSGFQMIMGLSVDLVGGYGLGAYAGTVMICLQVG